MKTELDNSITEPGGRKEGNNLNRLDLPVCVLHLPRHHGQELREVNGAVAVSVHLIDHVLELGLGGVLSQGPHHLKTEVRGQRSEVRGQANFNTP